MSTSAAPNTEPHQFIPHVERVKGYLEMAKGFGAYQEQARREFATMLLLVDLIDEVRGLSDDLRNYGKR